MLSAIVNHLSDGRDLTVSDQSQPSVGREGPNRVVGHSQPSVGREGPNRVVGHSQPSVGREGPNRVPPESTVCRTGGT